MSDVHEVTYTTSDDDDPFKRHWVGNIVTYSGTVFNIVEPDPETVLLEDIAQSLALSCRYNGHIPSFYSIAEHSVRVSEWIKAKGGSQEEQLTGLLHDAAEAYIGDMVRPLKRFAPIGTPFQAIEKKVEQAIQIKLGGLFPYPDIVHEADTAVYEWEVTNIRTGLRRGWAADKSKLKFTTLYCNLYYRQLNLFETVTDYNEPTKTRTTSHDGGWYVV